ncbi:LysR substrate-binding domain-containing protein [Nocardia cyriacigeorgica]|uniref:LysR substrate-binding domain-containing protein n=1 Tax=Nocardia cyriacigeorgica TaxID=135487 RepID=UPI00281257C0|nr:LysR substrate-binding domain-containing protein [Nocardia cyriacigeorgica]
MIRGTTSPAGSWERHAGARGGRPDHRRRTPHRNLAHRCLSHDTDPLLAEPIYLAASTDDPLAAHHASPWITGTSGTLCHTMTIRVCEAVGFTPRIRYHVDDFSAVLALVAAGRGIALVPELGALDPPEGVVLTSLPTRRRTRLAYRSCTRAHPAISAARNALHDCAAKHFPQCLP